VPVVAFPSTHADPTTGQSVATAVDRYLDSIQTITTRASYAETLARLTALAEGQAVAGLAPEDYAATMNGWNSAAAATWNRHLSALTSFTAWAQRQDLLETNPARRLGRRKPQGRGNRVRPLGHRHRPTPAPPLAGPHHRTGVPR
jgi:site-specific recombinase XerC